MRRCSSIKRNLPPPFIARKMPAITMALLLFKCLADIWCSGPADGQLPWAPPGYSWHCPGKAWVWCHQVCLQMELRASVSSPEEQSPIVPRYWQVDGWMDGQSFRHTADIARLSELAGWSICPIKSFKLRQSCQTSVRDPSKVFDFKSFG